MRKNGLRSLFGSGRSRFFHEPKRGGKSLSFKRKQRVKFRPRYASSVARKWSKTLMNTALTALAMSAMVWGGITLSQYWKSSTSLRVKQVVFSGDIPDSLKNSFPIRPNDHLMKLPISELQEKILRSHPELERFSIWRGLKGTISVSGTYRTPVARILTNNVDKGIDKDGIIFPLSGLKTVPDALPQFKCAIVEDRKTLLFFLSTLHQEVPEFYSLVKKIETDRMHAFFVELVDGVLIDWGTLNEAEITARASRILSLRERFEPTKMPATLTFVTTDRIVMNANWNKK